MPDTEHRKPFLQGRVGWLEIGFLALLAVSLGLRLWELDGRTMHYDEAIHLHFAWKLANMEEYIHSPWMHGPFQVEIVAALLLLFGDSDTIARLGFALFGTALVALPYLLRSSLGNAGSFITGAMLAVSPVLLYFSRFGRNDIIMAVWASLLFILMWRYFQEEKDRYLYLSAAVLGFMFATKETAFIVAATLGAITFLLAIPQIAPLLFRRERLRNLAGPAGFLFLLVTLTPPPVVGSGRSFPGLSRTRAHQPERRTHRRHRNARLGRPNAPTPPWSTHPSGSPLPCSWCFPPVWLPSMGGGGIT